LFLTDLLSLGLIGAVEAVRINVKNVYSQGKPAMAGAHTPDLPVANPALYR